jgi:F-box domain
VISGGRLYFMSRWSDGGTAPQNESRSDQMGLKIPRLIPFTVMAIFLLLPTDILCLIFDKLDLVDVLSCRQFSKASRALIDGEVISRYIFAQARFTFRGSILKDQPETRHYECNGRYQELMRCLSARLRSLHSQGPRFHSSIPLPRTMKFYYGCELLAMETRPGLVVDISNPMTRQVIFHINLEDYLGASEYERRIVDLRIRSSILSIAVVEKGLQRGRNYILFFRLGTNELSLLLKIARHRTDFSNNSKRDALYDFNSKFAAVCALKRRSMPTVNLWDLETGKLTMAEVSSGFFEDIAVDGPDSWCTLCATPSRPGSRGDVPPSCTLKRYSSFGDTISQTVVKLPRFANDRAWRDTYPFDQMGHFTLQGITAYENLVGVVWNRSLLNNWKTKLFYIDKFTGTVYDSRLFLTTDWTCFGSHVLFNPISEYVFIPHWSSTACDPETAISTFVPLRKTRGNDVGGASRPMDLKDSVQFEEEHVLLCQPTCQKRYPANKIPNRPLAGTEPLEIGDLDMHGDNQVIVFRFEDELRIYRFR